MRETKVKQFMCRYRRQVPWDCVYETIFDKLIIVVNASPTFERVIINPRLSVLKTKKKPYTVINFTLKLNRNTALTYFINCIQ